MSLGYFSAYGNPHSGSVISATTMKSLARFKNLSGKLLVKSYAVVFNKNLRYPIALRLALNLDMGSSITVELESVANQILKESRHMAFISLNGR